MMDLPLLDPLSHNPSKPFDNHGPTAMLSLVKLVALSLLLPATSVLSFQPVRSFVLSSALASSASSTADAAATMGEVKVGDAIPAVDMSELVTGADKPAKVNLKDLVAGKKVAIFGVPGAFTPGCSKSHLPSFITAQDDLKAKGVDMTICVATNDAYTMEVSQQIKPKA
jgi:Redoxin